MLEIVRGGLTLVAAQGVESKSLRGAFCLTQKLCGDKLAQRRMVSLEKLALIHDLGVNQGASELKAAFGLIEAPDLRPADLRTDRIQRINRGYRPAGGG
jgi:hypothetical protein